MKRLTLYLMFAATLAFVLGLSLARATPAAALPDAPLMASANYAVNWSAVGEISGGDSASAHYKLRGTIGQMGANTLSASVHYGLCSGFECVLSTLRTYLPAIRR